MRVESSENLFEQFSQARKKADKAVAIRKFGGLPGTGIMIMWEWRRVRGKYASLRQACW